MAETTTDQANGRTPLVDFDKWAQLARADPAAFEAKRAQVIEQLIEGTPKHKQRRLRCLQWKIDHVRARANSPMAACIKLSEMMWDSVLGPGGLRDALEGAADGKLEAQNRATVLNFKRAP